MGYAGGWILPTAPFRFRKEQIVRLCLEQSVGDGDEALVFLQEAEHASDIRITGFGEWEHKRLMSSNMSVRSRGL